MLNYIIKPGQQTLVYGKMFSMKEAITEHQEERRNGVDGGNQASDCRKETGISGT
jgi:hypothetical protein